MRLGPKPATTQPRGEREGCCSLSASPPGLSRCGRVAQARAQALLLG